MSRQYKITFRLAQSATQHEILAYAISRTRAVEVKPTPKKTKAR